MLMSIRNNPLHAFPFYFISLINQNIQWWKFQHSPRMIASLYLWWSPIFTYQKLYFIYQTYLQCALVRYPITSQEIARLLIILSHQSQTMNANFSQSEMWQQRITNQLILWKELFLHIILHKRFLHYKKNSGRLSYETLKNENIFRYEKL